MIVSVGMVGKLAEQSVGHQPTNACVGSWNQDASPGYALKQVSRGSAGALIHRV